MRILAIGDLHLGAGPSRLPEELASRAGELGTAEAFRRIVNAAIEQAVDAVIFAGDVVEDEDDFFEAYRELARAVGQLSGAGIRVLGVAGNHDVRVLPRLADAIQGFELLGREGQWESTTLDLQGERLTLHSWSFPQPRVRESPLQGHRFETRSGLNLGLLHADRDQLSSNYAPVSSRELEAAPLDGWLLGHIHKPDSLNAPNPSGYLGSATGLDPGESGPRGPWLLQIQGGRVVVVEQWLIAPLEWTVLTVDLTGLAAAEEARDRLIESVAGLDEQLRLRARPPEAVALRVSFTGRTDLGADVRRLLQREQLNALHAGDGRIHYFAERVIHATEPELSIAVLAQRSDPAGLLAQRLELLDRPAEDEQRRALIQKARRRLHPELDRTWWRALDDDEPDDDRIARWLRESGTAALERMLAQKTEAP